MEKRLDTLNYSLTPLRVQVIETLYVIRGGNARLIAQFIHQKLNCDKKEEKQIMNVLHRLKENGVITSRKLEGKYAGSMFYLSASGFELAKRLLDIKPNQRGSMWMKYKYPYNQKARALMRDYSYEAYKPPFQQYAHHQLIIKSIVSAYEKGVNQATPFRLTLDAVKKYTYRDDQKGLADGELKPDAELAIGNEIYALEIDRSTEYYAQLVNKFKNYKRYLDYAATNEQVYPVTKIIFVIDDTERSYGMARRWDTIFKAYLDGMGITDSYKSWPDIDLILTTVGGLADVINTESLRGLVDKNLVIENYAPFIHDKVATKSIIAKYRALDRYTTAFSTADKDEIILLSVNAYYNSTFYRYLAYQVAEKYYGLQDIDFYSSKVTIQQVLHSHGVRDSWEIDWRKSKANINLKKQLEMALSKVKYIKM
ncbi:replication-relaxation family protein [Lysinibacillus sp. 3P01SB]|uniref:replication-relaxation family protein n=1 Tax=Lysinibacillus sp. 3P01SB TaxID=3132284 RepID=UPI0039A65B1E